MNSRQLIKANLKVLGNIFLRSLKDLGKFVGHCTLGAVAVYTYDQNVGFLRRIKGPSMIPTLNSSQFNEFTDWDLTPRNRQFLQNDVVYFSRSIKNTERGDIVLLKRPRTNDYIVKRVVGVQGDIVTPIKPGGTEGEPVTLEEGQLWIESDAGFGYADSSLFGPVPKESIEGIGKFVIIFNLSSGLFRFLYRDIPKHVEGRVITAPENSQSKIQEAA